MYAAHQINSNPSCKSSSTIFYTLSGLLFFLCRQKLMTAVLPDLVNEGPQRLWWTTRRPWQSARPLCSSWSCLAVPIPRNLPPHCRPLINLGGPISPTCPALWSLQGALHSGRQRLHPLFHLPRAPPARLTRALLRICTKAGAGPTATNRYEVFPKKMHFLLALAFKAFTGSRVVLGHVNRENAFEEWSSWFVGLHFYSDSLYRGSLQCAPSRGVAEIIGFKKCKEREKMGFFFMISRLPLATHYKNDT